jgi:hypothetical protein
VRWNHAGTPHAAPAWVSALAPVALLVAGATFCACQRRTPDRPVSAGAGAASRAAENTTAAPVAPATSLDARSTRQDPGSAPAGAQFERDGGALPIDVRDCEQIRMALVRRIEESQFEHRDRMLEAIRRAEVTIGPEGIWIGGWSLSDSDGWSLLYRTGPGPSPAYGADAERAADGWSVGPVHPVFIHPRR